MNEEQYGVIVCEMENEYFTYIYSITPQICSAIKLTNLVAKLESSLDAAQSRNNVLNRMSMIDELTGVYNRRGFYVSANRILKAPENEGRLPLSSATLIILKRSMILSVTMTATMRSFPAQSSSKRA